MGIAFSIIIGLICALIVHYKIPVARQIVKYISNCSATHRFWCSSFYLFRTAEGGTFHLRGCLRRGGSGTLREAALYGGGVPQRTQAIEPIQMESALSLGMTKKQAVLYVILPQAVSISVPAFVANVIFLLKETSVFSAISLMDLMFTAKDLIGLYYKTAGACSYWWYFI